MLIIGKALFSNKENTFVWLKVVFIIFIYLFIYFWHGSLDYSIFYPSKSTVKKSKNYFQSDIDCYKILPEVSLTQIIFFHALFYIRLPVKLLNFNTFLKLSLQKNTDMQEWPYLI